MGDLIISNQKEIRLLAENAVKFAQKRCWSTRDLLAIASYVLRNRLICLFNATSWALVNDTCLSRKLAMCACSKLVSMGQYILECGYSKVLQMILLRTNIGLFKIMMRP